MGEWCQMDFTSRTFKTTMHSSIRWKRIKNTEYEAGDLNEELLQSRSAASIKRMRRVMKGLIGILKIDREALAAKDSDELMGGEGDVEVFIETSDTSITDDRRGIGKTKSYTTLYL